MSVATFAGTVTGCCTRASVKRPVKALLTHCDPKWILTLAITEADAGFTFAAGAEQAFAIHSPVQLLHDTAEECVGRHYRFEVTLDDATGKLEWISLSVTR
jgi:hypothetical protein